MFWNILGKNFDKTYPVCWWHNLGGWLSMLFALRDTSSWSLHFVSSSKYVLAQSASDQTVRSHCMHREASTPKNIQTPSFWDFSLAKVASSVASIFGRLLVNDASPSLLAMRSQRILMSPSTHSKLVMSYYCHLYCSISSHFVVFHIFTFGWILTVS